MSRLKTKKKDCHVLFSLGAKYWICVCVSQSKCVCFHRRFCLDRNNQLDNRSVVFFFGKECVREAAEQKSHTPFRGSRPTPPGSAAAAAAVAASSAPPPTRPSARSSALTSECVSRAPVCRARVPSPRRRAPVTS